MKKQLEKNNGITLMTLVITIIVLIILSGISIGMITGNNGIINNAKIAKENTEIAEEKEIVTKSATQSMGKNKYNNVTKKALEERLNQNVGKRKTKVYSYDEGYVVIFVDTNRLYLVNIEGNVEEGDSDILREDPTPGDITKDENERTIAGTEADPYIIMSIEDLVEFSQNTRNGTNYYRKYVKLGRNLDFKSELSYCNYETKEYNEFLGIEDDVGLMEALTNTKYAGFVPINAFQGTFVGDNKTIKNIYENIEGNAGLFTSLGSLGQGTVKDLTITGQIKSTGDNAAAVSAGKSGTILNCISYVNIESTGNNVASMSTNNGTITNCINYGTLKGKNNVGGISVGNARVQNCINYGNITAESYAAGISGGYANVNWNCKNYGEIVASANCAAGIAARTAQNMVINRCINYGKVTANQNAGGILAHFQSGYILNCINTASVKANITAGGISAKDIGFQSIINCVNEASVEANSLVGGIHGKSEQGDGNILNCYNRGDLIGNENIGEIFSYKSNYGTFNIKKCYSVDRGNPIYISTSNGIINIENTTLYSKNYMKQNEFLNLLNNYVTTFNLGDMTESNSNELLEWVFDSKTGFPTIDLEN